MLEVLVLDPARGLCYLDGHIHEVRLNLHEELAEELLELLESREGGVCIELDVDLSGRGRLVGLR